MKQKSKNISLKSILIAIGAGIWIIVLQNTGIIPKLLGAKNGIQTVYVTGGNIDSDIRGSVDVNGSVSIDDEVDINIRHINGWEPANYYSYSRDGKEYHSLGTK